MKVIQQPEQKSAYDFALELINSKDELDSALEVMARDNLLTEYENKHLERPNTSYRQRFIVVRNILSRSPNVTRRYKIGNWLETLRQHIRTEHELCEAIKDPNILDQILPIDQIGYVNGVKDVDSPGSMNHPIIVRADKGEFFIRYTSALGGASFLRSDPKETIFRHLLGEQTFQLFIGPYSTTKTLYPSLEQAFFNFHGDEGPTIEKFLKQRIILQPSYIPEYFKIEDYKEHGENFDWLVIQFANMNAIVHAATFGVNFALGFHTSTKIDKKQNNFIKSNKSYFRYFSHEEYDSWFRNVNWVSNMVNFMNKDNNGFPPTDQGILHNYMQTRNHLMSEGIDIEEMWWQIVEKSAYYWKQGAILSGPDIKPSNAFYRNGQIRFYDFDYFAFFDPAYHLGQGIYTVLRFATTKEDIYDPIKLLSYSKKFMCKYLEYLEMEYEKKGGQTPDTFKTDEFLSRVYTVSAVTFFYVMMHDVKEKNISSLQQEAIIGLIEEMLK